MFHNNKRVRHQEVITVINLKQKLTKIKGQKENSTCDTIVIGWFREFVNQVGC